MRNWDEMHKEGNRPWDLKGVTPILQFFVENEAKNFEINRMKSICVPGCGQVT